MEGDRLTVKLDRAPLPLVLAELARQAGAQYTVTVLGGGGVLVSDRFKGLHLQDGLRRLLQHENHLLAYEQVPTAPGTPVRWRLKEIVLVADAQSKRASSGAGDSELARSHPDTRIHALERWAWERPQDTLDPLTQALVDPDEQVRSRAQELLEEELARR